MVTVSPKYNHGQSIQNPELPLGYSEVFQNTRILKSDSACEIHSMTERTRVQAGKTLQALPPETEPFIIDTLEFLFSNSFNLSSFAFTRGTQVKYAFGESLCLNLIEQIATLREGLDSTSFVAFGHPLTLRFDSLRIQIRELEQKYIEWVYSPWFVHQYFLIKKLELAGVESSYENSDVIFKAVIYTAQYLNDLSTWAFWASRYLAEKFNLPQTEWTRENTNL